MAVADWPATTCECLFAPRRRLHATPVRYYYARRNVLSAPPVSLPSRSLAVSCAASRAASARPMSSAKPGQRPIMPRPSFPPTPAPSTDITAKSSSNAGQFDVNFALPPAAIASARGSVATDVSSGASNASDSSYRPLSPASPVATTKTAPASRKRPSTAQSSVVTKDDYSLPPPPTRSRKIIQMKPKESQEQPRTAEPTLTAKAAPAAAAGVKRKQSGGTTAAGRKIARKTAHSLIERRRRSKMNEEFGVLKDMIPACAGQEMHKLAILQVRPHHSVYRHKDSLYQASIEYMRYLQQCVDDLKVAHRSSRRASPAPTSPRTEPYPAPRTETLHEDEEDEEDDGDEDEDMSDAVSPKHTSTAVAPNVKHSLITASPAMYPSDRSVYSTTTSPVLHPGDHRNYSAAISPALQPSDPRHYSLASSIRSTATSPSIQASPACGGHTPSQAVFHNPFHATLSNKNSMSGPSGGNFALTSPALGPQPDREDHEATEALLMLNTDRRSWNGGGRGMSVKDLLG
jgi:hypothetical protein